GNWQFCNKILPHPRDAGPVCRRSKQRESHRRRQERVETLPKPIEWADSRDVLGHDGLCGHVNRPLHATEERALVQLPPACEQEHRRVHFQEGICRALNATWDRTNREDVALVEKFDTVGRLARNPREPPTLENAAWFHGICQASAPSTT